MIVCSNCRKPYPDTGVPYCCPDCGGLYDYAPFPSFNKDGLQPSQSGIWCYQEMLGLPDHAAPVSLGEGNTPLVWAEFFGRKVALKCEVQNPTGSFKDRGSATLVSFLQSRQVSEAVEDSSGNAGASFAAYTARAGIRARVFVPESASGPKRAQIEAYGAQVERIPGPRSNAAEAVRRAAARGAVYGSHAYLPFNLPGYATLAYELVEQLGEAPGAVILPAGQGGLLLGVGRGLQAMQQAGVIAKMPPLVGVQARACAPLWATFSYGLAGLQFVTEGATVAEGIRVKTPLRGDAVLQIVEASGGSFTAVDEGDILSGRDQLAHRGFYVETTSAVVWKALEQLAEGLPDPIVLVLTGSGLKNSS